MTERLGDAPIEPAYRQQMNDLAKLIDVYFNGDAKGVERKTGFILMVFPFGEGEGRCNYLSNGANRDEVVVMMKEQIKRFEGQPDLTGHG